MRKEKDEGLRYTVAPSVEPHYDQPDSCFDIVNQYGTYNIQPTADTTNDFPFIAQGLPKKWRKMSLDKDDVERRG